MPCSKYKGRQRAACYATNEWQRPVRKTGTKKKTAKKKSGASAPSKKGKR